MLIHKCNVGFAESSVSSCTSATAPPKASTCSWIHSTRHMHAHEKMLGNKTGMYIHRQFYSSVSLWWPVYDLLYVEGTSDATALQALSTDCPLESSLPSAFAPCLPPTCAHVMRIFSERIWLSQQLYGIFVILCGLQDHSGHAHPSQDVCRVLGSSYYLYWCINRPHITVLGFLTVI